MSTPSHVASQAIGSIQGAIDDAGRTLVDFLTFPARAAIRPMQDLEFKSATGQLSFPEFPPLPGAQSTPLQFPTLPGMQAQALPQFPAFPTPQGMQSVVPTLTLPGMQGAQSLPMMPAIPVPQGAQSVLKQFPGIDFKPPETGRNMQGSDVLISNKMGSNQASDILLL